MFKKLSDTLNLLMAKTRINANELARCTGLPASTIKKIRNNDSPNPTLMTLIPLAQHFSISLSQLVGEEIINNQYLVEHQFKQNGLYHLPILNWETVIHWPSATCQPSSTIFIENNYPYSTHGLFVEEENWENFVKDTLLIIDPTIKPAHRDFVIVHKEGAHIPTLKQVLYDEEKLYLKSTVPGYPLTPFSKNHRFLGVVIEYRKKIKSAKLT